MRRSEHYEKFSYWLLIVLLIVMVVFSVSIEQLKSEHKEKMQNIENQIKNAKITFTWCTFCPTNKEAYLEWKLEWLNNSREIISKLNYSDKQEYEKQMKCIKFDSQYSSDYDVCYKQKWWVSDWSFLDLVNVTHRF